jgi:hypothetical protein
MAKFVKFPNDGYQVPLPEEGSVQRQMLDYLQTKYGENPVDQFDLMLELNTHQMDTEVLKERSMRPLSQLFGFFISDWVKAGFAERVTAKVLLPQVKEPGKMARMEGHIHDLEALLRANNIDFHPFEFGAPKANPTPEPAQAAA